MTTNGVVWSKIIMDAIKQLDASNGSTRQEIFDFIINNNNFTNSEVVHTRITMGLTRMLCSGKLVEKKELYTIAPK